jgi:hypothetical protein
MKTTEFKQRTLITEQVTYILWESAGRKIIEAQLTPDQISKLFTNVEQGATAAGGNRTMVGKGKDAAGAVNKAWTELKSKIQDSAPVKNVDAMYDQAVEKLKKSTGGDEGVDKYVQKYRAFAKKHPMAQSFVYAALIAAAGISGAGAGGAAALGLFKLTDKLLQGEKFSSAAYSGAKTGALAYGAAKLADYVRGDTKVTTTQTTTSSSVGGGEAPTTISQIQARTPNSSDMAVANAIKDEVGPVAASNYLTNIGSGNPQSPDIKAIIKKLFPTGESTYYPAAGKQFTTLQIETIIEWCDLTPAVMLTEGPLDAIKKGAAAAGGALKKGASAVGAKAKTVGKNMTTKVTADKLNKAWVKAGKPTDSDAIANILRQQGVDDKILAPVYKQMGAKLPAAPTATDAPKTNAAPQQSKPSTQQTPTAKQGTAAPGAKPAAATMDFKSIQQSVAKLTPGDAKALVTHIDSLSGKKTAAQPQTAPKQGATAQQQPTQGQPAPGKQKPAAQNPKNAAAGDTYEKAKGDIRKAQSGTKPIPPKAAADIQTAIAKLAKGDKESGVFAAQKIMNLAKAGVDISKQQQAWVANAKAGERFLTQSVYFEISKMLREHNLSWSDLGVRVHLLEGTNKMFGVSYI